MMGRTASRWVMRDQKSGKVVFEGTTKECADYAGINHKTFHTTVTRYGKYKRWLVEETFSATDRSTENEEAIRRWDAFMEPLRKKYGIPVRRIRFGQ